MTDIRGHSTCIVVVIRTCLQPCPSRPRRRERSSVLARHVLDAKPATAKVVRKNRYLAFDCAGRTAKRSIHQSHHPVRAEKHERIWSRNLRPARSGILGGRRVSDNEARCQSKFELPAKAGTRQRLGQKSEAKLFALDGFIITRKNVPRYKVNNTTNTKCFRSPLLVGNSDDT